MDALDKLDAISSSVSWRSLAAETTDKEYRKLVALINVTSYSQLSELHACPRKFVLNKAAAALGEAERINNTDFAFGHSVGAGVQTYFATGDVDQGLFAGFVSWKLPYDATNASQKRPTPTKSIILANLAIEKFAAMGLHDEWEVVILPNGKPAVEVAFRIDCENGYKHYGHIDIILRNKRTGQIAVGEFKTSGFTNVDEALYANSSQALGYSVVIDAIFPGFTDYEVLYFVYSAVSREWNVMPFNKSRTAKAEFLQDLLLDHSAISTYRKMNFWPKRGESCFNYSRRCEHFGVCNLTTHTSAIKELGANDEAEDVDFKFTLSDLIASQGGSAGE